MTNLLHQPVNPTPTLVWYGASGTAYEFYHYRIGTIFNAVPGVYVFCRLAADGRWYAEYIGETDNLSRRLSSELAAHHQAANISRSGATHICAMVVPGDKAARLNIETDLRHSQNPPCNQQ